MVRYLYIDPFITHVAEVAGYQAKTSFDWGFGVGDLFERFEADLAGEFLLTPAPDDTREAHLEVTMGLPT